MSAVVEAQGAAPAASVIVCSHSRRELLARTLRAIRAAIRADGPAVEVIVVDNGPSGHVAPIVAAIEAEAPDTVNPAFRAIVAGPPNISAARNAGLAAARAPLVAFVDDDQAPAPGWLDRLREGLEATGADAAFSRIDVEIETGDAAAWDALGRPHERVYPLPDGAIVNPPEARRPLGLILSTGGTLLRRETCLDATDAPGRFDLGFGLSGGEDFDFFARLDRAGRRFVWAPRSVVVEWVPASRLEPGYRMLRGYSGGQVYAAAVIKNARRPALAALDLMLRGVVQTALYGAAFLGAAAFGGRHRRAYLADRMASGAGKALWWRKLGFYAVENAAGRRG
jgi:succinoglycan biosynthesis protein ExoM